MDAESFIFHTKTNNIYKGIVKDVETRFEISNYELDRPLLRVKSEKVVNER